MIADECSKSVKTSDQSFSRIQALFLDAVGPLSGMLDSINKGTELAVEDVEDAVKAALNFLGNASSQCTSLRRTGILREYNKDLVSYGLESNELFSSATTTLLGPAFPEKAAAHLQQMQTLRNSRAAVSKVKQGFQRAPRTKHSGGASPTTCRDATNHTPGVAGATGHQRVISQND